MKGKTLAVTGAALLLVACGGSAVNADPPTPGVVKKDVVYNLYDLPDPHQDVVAFCDGAARVYMPEDRNTPVVVDEDSTECR